MTSPFLLAGLIVLIVVSVDIIAVTIGVTTRRTATGMVGRLVFDGLRHLGRLLPVLPVTAVSGTLVMIAVSVFWIGGTWIGWTLIFGSVPDSIEQTQKGLEPEGYDYAAHTGQLLSTLGGGQTAAGGPIWSILSVLVGVNGMVVLTLSVSFLLSVRQTVQSGRAFAALQDVGAMPPGESLERLADMVAALHSAPFALWYGHPREDRQLPSALLAHAQAARDAGGRDWVRTATILEDLPHLPDGAERADLIDRLRTWAERHTVVDLGEDAEAAG